jgi:alkyl hydroperoxide reductase subunit AhpC
VPATEELLPRFRAADTQVLGISVDSLFCHANWGMSLGGISFPLLQDFQPKGAVADSFGLYLADAGITDRATVIIDKNGVVQFKGSVTPAGERDIAQLAAKCEEINAGDATTWPACEGAPADATLYVKAKCGHSLKARLAVENLHLGGSVVVKNVTEDASAMAELESKGGKAQAPCLIHGETALYEADDIVKLLVDRCAPVF